MNVNEARAQNIERRLDELERIVREWIRNNAPEKNGLRGDTTDGPRATEKHGDLEFNWTARVE